MYISVGVHVISYQIKRVLLDKRDTLSHCSRGYVSLPREAILNN